MRKSDARPTDACAGSKAVKRIFGPYVYGPGPRAGCFWDSTCDVPQVPALEGAVSADVAVVGGGFTGLNAALTLARNGAQVVVLDAESPGWGASGRNGGFCCLGGGKLDDAALDRRFGKAARLEWRQTEVDAVAHVTSLLAAENIDADTHSNGETWLAHRARDMDGIDEAAREVEENYGVAPQVLSADDLLAEGKSAGFFGGLTTPIGFALNPRKYVAGLCQALLKDGVRMFGRAPVTALKRVVNAWELRSHAHKVIAKQVVWATNGYSSEDSLPWLNGRYMPTQSSVGVTRPLTRAERDAQGWTSHQMCYDSRNLLHYFRLMPDNRLLFGLRGGLGGTARSEDRAQARLRRDFDAMFPAWRGIAFTHTWSGMVALSRQRMPFVGHVPKAPGVVCAMCYHGNGVAMGSLSGHLAAQLTLGMSENTIPTAMRSQLGVFPFGRLRRVLMPPIYLGLHLADQG